MLGRKSVVHVDGDTAESFDPSSAVECFIVEIAETKAPSVIHYENRSAAHLSRL